jgi:hypothetical protein
MPARTVKIRHDDQTRAKIQTSQILNRLIDHVVGKVELSTTQVRAAEILLKKVLPDLTATEHSGEIAIGDGRQLSDAELAALAIADRSQRDIEAARSSSKLN